MDWLSAIYYLGLMFSFLFLPMFTLLGVLAYIRKKEASRRANPLTEDLFRTPGFSLQQRIDSMQWNLMESMMMIPVLTAIIPALFFIQVKIEGRNTSFFSWVPIIILIVIGLVYYVRKFFKQIKKIENLRLGYACEMAVGQQLEQIVRPDNRPYRVYHDIPFEGFNIDHLVVGPKGVFVIETKGRSKPLHNGSKLFKVSVKGDVLHFPKHVEHEPILQVKRNVQAVRKWLSDATGFDVTVEGVLTIPGWYVTSDEKIRSPRVMNPKQLPYLFPDVQLDKLDLKKIQAISYQISHRVKDVDRERVDRIASRPLKNY